MRRLPRSFFLRSIHTRSHINRGSTYPSRTFSQSGCSDQGNPDPNDYSPGHSERLSVRRPFVVFRRIVFLPYRWVNAPKCHALCRGISQNTAFPSLLKPEVAELVPRRPLPLRRSPISLLRSRTLWKLEILICQPLFHAKAANFPKPSRPYRSFFGFV